MVILNNHHTDFSLLGSRNNFSLQVNRFLWLKAVLGSRGIQEHQNSNLRLLDGSFAFQEPSDYLCSYLVLCGFIRRMCANTVCINIFTRISNSAFVWTVCSPQSQRFCYRKRKTSMSLDVCNGKLQWLAHLILFTSVSWLADWKPLLEKSNSTVGSPAEKCPATDLDSGEYVLRQ